MSKFRIKETTYEDGEVQYTVQMETEYRTFVTITYRPTLELAREVIRVLESRNIVNERIVE